MAVAVTCTVTPKLELKRTDTLTGGAVSQLAYSLPLRFQGLLLTCTKAWGNNPALLANTPQTLDLTALSGGRGDASFADIKLLDVRNLEAPGSGRVLTLGGDGSANAFIGPFVTATNKITVQPGCAVQLFTLEAGGWPVGTTKLLKLDPGANPVSCAITLAGD